MENQTNSYVIEITVPNAAEGLRIIEKSNGNSKGIFCPRSEFQKCKSMPEFNKAGVYVLWGPDDKETSTLPKLYIGEGDPVRPRLEHHYRDREKDKDFWTRLVLFVSIKEINKAHIQYLESRLVALASQAKRGILGNGNIPAAPSLSVNDKAKADNLLEEMLLCMPLLGLSAFETPPSRSWHTDYLILKGKGIEAHGFETGGGFVVKRGSGAVSDESSGLPPYVLALRNTLRQNGTLGIAGDALTLTQDYTFDSPSAAAATLLARSANGRIEWKNKNGQTLRELQEASTT